MSSTAMAASSHSRKSLNKPSMRWAASPVPTAAAAKSSKYRAVTPSLLKRGQTQSDDSGQGTNSSASEEDDRARVLSDWEGEGGASGAEKVESVEQKLNG